MKPKKIVYWFDSFDKGGVESICVTWEKTKSGWWRVEADDLGRRRCADWTTRSQPSIVGSITYAKKLNQ